jgi:3-methyladenine DNA glycosylase AlkD
MSEFCIALEDAFRDLANAENAGWMRKYMRDQFPFLGIKKPEREQVFSELYRLYGNPTEFIETSKYLFSKPEREFQYIAMDYVRKSKSAWDERVPLLVEEWIGQESWWDVVDVLGPQIMGPYFLKFPAQRAYWIQRWMASGNFWLQRVCLVFQLNYKGKTDRDLLADVIIQVAGSKEFFIQKAIGWALRQFARYDADWVRDFVATNSLAPLSKREAMKHIGII